MFGRHPDKMPPESTPERLYALCKWTLTQPASRKELEGQLVMQNVFGQQVGLFGRTMKTAEELGLVDEKDGVVHVKAPACALDDYVSFRRFIAGVAFNDPDTTFFKFSEWYLAKNETVYSCKNWEEVAVKAHSEGVSVVEEDMMGWRWWASFLGLGYLHNTILIANLATRIQDCLVDVRSEFTRGESIPAPNFVEWLERKFPETQMSRNVKVLGLGISNGLRVLDSQGHIIFTAQRDADRWSLFPIEGVTLNDFSHVMIKG